MCRSAAKQSSAALIALLLSQTPSVLHAEPFVLDAINVTADSSKREDLKPDSITNPYRVESTARFGTEVFTQKEIEAYAPKDIFDLLNKAAGLNLTYQGRRSPFFLDQRGGGLLTYILDGAVLPPSSNRILQKLPIADIEEIQVVRGATSLNLGPTIAIGSGNTGSGLNTGFVVIRTKRPTKTEGVLSAYGEKSGSLPLASGESLYTGTHFGSSTSSSNGYIAGGLSNYNRPSNDTWFDGQDGKSGMINGGLQVGKFNLNYTGYTDTGSLEMQRGVTYTGALDSSKWYYDPLKTTILSSDMSMAWSKEQVTIFSLFKTRYEQTEHNESFVNTTSSIRNYSEESSGLSLRHNAQFGDALVQIGGQLSSSNGFGPNLSNPYNNFDTTIKGWSSSIEQKLFNGEVTLDAGYRRDIKHINVSSTSASSNLANHDVDMAPSIVYALGARWQINDLWALNARYFQGDEGDSGDFTLKTQNGSALHAEKQKRIELALEATPSTYFKPMLTWFDYDIQNQKTATTNTYVSGGNTYYYYTEANALRKGIEVAIKGNVAATTSYNFSWTHMLTNNTTSNGLISDAIGISFPENYFTALLSHAWDKNRANLSMKQVSSWQTTASPVGILNADLGGYTTIDANITRDFLFSGYKLTTTVYGRNLGNEHYSTRYVTGYYPDRGRTIGLEVSLAF